MNVIWTHEAEKSFNSIIDFLLDTWTPKEANAFIALVDNMIRRIRLNPEMFKISEYDNQSREAVVTKHTTMFYNIQDDVITIAYFWGNYGHPEKLKAILK